MDETGKPGVDRRQFQQNLLFSVLITVLGLITNIFHTLVDRVALARGMEATAAGLLISVMALGSLSSVILSSALADHVGKRRVILVALLILATGLYLLSIQGSFLLLLAALFLYGFGFSPSEAMSSAVLTDENPRRASAWMNVAQAGFSLGAIAGPVIAAAFVLARGSYHGLFLLCCLLVLAFSAVILVTARGRLGIPRHGQRPPMNMFSVLKERRFRYLALMIFLYLGYESISPVYAKQLFLASGASETMASLMISLFWGAMIVGRLVGTMLTGKEMQSIRAFTAVAFLGLLLLVVGTSMPVRIAGIALVGLGCGPVWPMLVVLAARLFPERSGSAIGMMMLSCVVGITLFPTLIGTLPRNLTVTFVLCAVLAALVFLVSHHARSEEARAQADRPA